MYVHTSWMKTDKVIQVRYCHYNLFEWIKSFFFHSIFLEREGSSNGKSYQAAIEIIFKLKIIHLGCINHIHLNKFNWYLQKFKEIYSNAERTMYHFYSDPLENAENGYVAVSENLLSLQIHSLTIVGSIWVLRQVRCVILLIAFF